MQLNGAENLCGLSLISNNHSSLENNLFLHLANIFSYLKYYSGSFVQASRNWLRAGHLTQNCLKKLSIWNADPAFSCFSYSKFKTNIRERKFSLNYKNAPVKTWQLKPWAKYLRQTFDFGQIDNRDK